MEKHELELLESCCPLIQRLKELTDELVNVSQYSDDSWSFRTLQNINDEYSFVLHQIQEKKRDLISLWCVPVKDFI